MALIECMQKTEVPLNQRRYSVESVKISSQDTKWTYQCDCTSIPNYHLLTIDNFNLVAGTSFSTDLQTSTSAGWKSGGFTITDISYNENTGIYTYAVRLDGFGYWSNGHEIKGVNVPVICFV